MGSAIEDQIRTFVSRHFRNHDLRNDEDMFALGVVNSLFAMQLVAFLEMEFKITVNDEDLDIDNFRTINSLVAFVQRKQA